MHFKTILMGCILMIASSLSYAQPLRCKQNFNKIQDIVLKEKEIFDHGTFEELIVHTKQFEYDELFKRSHPQQKYMDGRWSDEDEYYSRLKESFDFFHGQQFKFELVIKNTDQNFRLGQKELCIFNVQFVPNKKINGEGFESTYIAVRLLTNQNWRLFLVNEKMSEKDLNEFFPNFPKNVIIKALDYTHK